MRRILLLATTTGYQTRAFGEAARTLGAELIFATDRCHILEDPWRDGAIPIRFYDEDGSVTAILEAARARPFDGLIAVGDRPTLIAARAAEQMGLPGNAPDAVAIACDKQRMRECLRDAGLPVPWFLPWRIDGDARKLLPSVSFPCVVKPVSLSGSRGVIRADDPESLYAALDRVRKLMASAEIRAERNAAHDRLMVEGFIPGREFALEGLLHHGELTVLALFDKPDPLDGPFFEETIYITPSGMPAAVQRQIADAVGRAVAAIGLRHGPVHAECRVNDGGVYVLEIAARPIGGLCARSLRFETAGGDGPISLEELLLRHAIGQGTAAWSREARASGVMMIPIPGRGVYRGVSGVEDAGRIAGIDAVTMTAKIDQVLVPLPEGASYLGFIFGHGRTPESVDRSLRAAHACLRFTIEPELPVVTADQMRYTDRHHG